MIWSQLAYRPFLDPLPGAWANGVWMMLIVPLCVGVAVVYKSIKISSMKRLPREVLVLTVMILLGMAAAAIALAGLVRGVEYFRS